MLSAWSLPYRPIAQEQHEKLLHESDSASDLLEVRNECQTRENWLGKTALCLAVVNVLVAIAAVITLHDISKLRIPMAAVDISALPRPDPYVGLNLCMFSLTCRNILLIESALQKVLPWFKIPGIEFPCWLHTYILLS
jgi:hypothetical protein